MSNPQPPLGSSLVVLLLCSSLMTLQAADTNQIATFTAFLSDRPVIAEMIAAVCTKDSRKGHEGETNCYFALLRHQTNAFFYREAPSILGLATTNLFDRCRLSGYYDDDFWDFSADGRVLVTSASDQANVKRTVQHVLRKASLLLHMGVFDALPGTVKWNGPEIIPMTNFVGVQLSGALSVAEAGNVMGLTLLTRYDGNEVPWRIAYDFDGHHAIPPYLPSRIRGYAVRGGLNTLNFDVHVLSVKLASAPLPKSFFTPEAFVNPRLTTEIIQTLQGDYYSTKADPTRRNVESRRSENTRDNIDKRLAVYGVLFILSCMMVVFILRQRRNPNTSVN